MRFQETLGKEGLRVLLVHEPCRDLEHRARVDAFAAERKPPFPILLSTKEVQEAYGITGIPTRVLIDRVGRIVLREAGFGPGIEKNLEERIRAALESRGAPAQGSPGPR